MLKKQEEFKIYSKEKIRLELSNKDIKDTNKLISEELLDKNFDELIYIFKYEGLIRKLILDYKFNEKSYLYLSFANFILNDKKIIEKIKKYDKIIPVPISKARFKQRGYNQTDLIATKIAKETKMELLNNCLIKTKNIIEQSKLNKEDREQNIQGAYILQNKELIENQKILLMDDIYTTGNTANECCKTLLQGNPKTIGVFTIAKD